MRLVSFLKDEQVRLGTELEGAVVDLNLAYRRMLESDGETSPRLLADALLPSDVIEFLKAGDRALSEAQKALTFAKTCAPEDRQGFVLAEDTVKRLSPVPKPGKIVCVGRNYLNHIAEMNRDIPTIPVLFAKLSNTICAHGDEVPFPRVSDQLDYEAELAVVIGRTGRYIEEADALDYVAGYTVFNDITVRDWQSQTPQWLQGKSFDKSAPAGPVLVTKDDIANPHDLGIRLWLNEELRQNDHTSRLIFKIPFLISFISKVMTLEPGDIIATGTPGGVGAAMNPKGFMKPGDVVRVEIDQIGILENRIVTD